MHSQTHSCSRCMHATLLSCFASQLPCPLDFYCSMQSQYRKKKVCLFRPYYFTSGVSSVGREGVCFGVFVLVCLLYLFWVIALYGKKKKSLNVFGFVLFCCVLFGSYLILHAECFSLGFCYI